MGNWNNLYILVLQPSITLELSLSFGALIDAPVITHCKKMQGTKSFVLSKFTGFFSIVAYGKNGEL